MPKDEGGRIRLVVFELEGSNETLQDSMRTIAAALQGRSSVQQRTVSPAQPLVQTNGKHVNAANEQPALDIYEDNNEDEEIETKKNKKPNGNKPRNYPTPQILNIDLESGDIPFKEFWKQKHNPTADSKRYLVIAAWFHLYQKVNEISDDHIYTCYRAMNLNVQKDVLQPFRKMKGQGWFNAGQTKGLFAINHIGLGVVNDMGNRS